MAEKRVAVARGQVGGLSAKGVEVVQGEAQGKVTSSPTTSTTLPCDVLVCGTGFQREYDYLPPQQRAALGVAPDGLYLYRHVLPLGVPDLAFIGAETATISNVATHGLQAEWLARLLAGRHALPPAPTMAAAVAQHAAWARSWMPDTPSRASLVLLHQVHYHDTLLKDLGVPHRRKGNPLSELFMPYRPRDYNGIVGK